MPKIAKSHRVFQFAEQAKRILWSIIQQETALDEISKEISLTKAIASPDLYYVKIYFTVIDVQKTYVVEQTLLRYKVKLEKSLSIEINKPGIKISFFYDNTSNKIQEIEKLINSIKTTE
jgi:ribosome-binding factor A